MARKGWQSLSAGYRQRLEKAGISQQDYDSGVSIQKARGHGQTPENPRNYDPVDYPIYHTERERLIQELEDRKRELWGDSPRWDERKAARNIREYPPSLQQMRWAVQATDEEIMDAIREAPQDYAWLGYH